MASNATGEARNRLGNETSPYLRQHQHNPVDWYPWGEEALERARQENKPIFLSIGYSTCYWCHVMERESFSNEAIAELMNQHFVNIKIDREERPDLDEIYMAATQLLTQQGGWPNSVFLTPDLRPFYAGTYFPPMPKHGMPGFGGLVQGLAKAWEDRRSDVQMQAEELENAMRHFLEERGEPQAETADAASASRSLEALKSRFDDRHGGFGGAPKFPTPANLYLLEGFVEEDDRATQMLHATLDAMARGGIYDQLAGGFHRYATDGEWLIPHFEKMLYDNGHLLELYARHHHRTQDVESARIVRETVTFLEREMSHPDGGFYSAIDAETNGHEGAYHVWTKTQIQEALGPEDASFLAPIYGYDEPPFFEGEYYVLHLPQSLAIQADRRRITREELLSQLEPLKTRLLSAREERQHPRIDDKILTDWNGMAISGLAVAGRCLEEPAFVERAARAADFLLQRLRPEGRLLHSWREGTARIEAFLGDYVFLVRGLLALYDATGDDRWLHHAAELTDEQSSRLADENGGFYVAGQQDDILFRSKEVFDGAIPATNGVAILNLIDLWQRSGDERWLTAAAKTLRAFATLIEQRPDAARMLALANRRYHQLTGQDAADTVSLKLDVEAADGNWRPFVLHVEIADGWHLYAADAPATFLATRLETSSDGGEVVREVEYPDGEAVELAGETVQVYTGTVQVRGQVRSGTGEIRLHYQACDDRRCLAPVVVELAVP